MHSPIKTPTPTPRTDSVASILAALSTPTSEQYVLASFARQLETELAEANKERDERTAAFAAQNAYVGKLADEVTQLRTSLAASQERVKELEEGLRDCAAGFAVAVASHGLNPDDNDTLRDARRVLAKSEVAP